MRYGIFSDVHSNLEALDAVIEAYQEEGIDKYVCAGDIVGYAVNPKECIEKVKAIASVTVAGNHDWASVDLFSLDHFNSIPCQALLWTRDNLDDKSRHSLKSLELTYKNEDFILVHGALDAPGDFNYMSDGYIAQRTFQLMDTDICFVGHTHVAGVFIKEEDGRLLYEEGSVIAVKGGKKYIVNAGSVGQPRDGNPKAAYCIYDTEKKEVCIKRIDYDIQAARNKIIACGLSKSLGDRLLSGR